MKSFVAVVVALAALTACSSPKPEATSQAKQDSVSQRPKPAGTLARFRVPNESEVKDSVTLASIRRGRALIHSTKDSLPQFTGANLTCANCHINDGTERDAAARSCMQS